MQWEASSITTSPCSPHSVLEQLWKIRGTAVLPSRKSDQEISKSHFYQTIFLPTIRPKADPNMLFWCQNQTCSKNLILTLSLSSGLFRQKKKRTKLGSFFKKGPLSDQGLTTWQHWDSVKRLSPRVSRVLTPCHSAKGQCEGSWATTRGSRRTAPQQFGQWHPSPECELPPIQCGETVRSRLGKCHHWHSSGMV